MSATDLPEILEDNFEPGFGVEYLGYHLVSQGNGTYVVQMDGYAGEIERIDVDDYDNALEIVDDLNRVDTLREEHMYYGDDEDLVDWAGPIMTSDEDLAEEEPERYIYVPPPEEVPDNAFGDENDGED